MAGVSQNAGQRTTGLRLVFLTGDQQGGKTSLVLDLAQQARSSSLHVAGIACPGLWEAGERSGFDLLELDTGRRISLSRRVPGLRPVPFRFESAALESGRQALAVSRWQRADLVVVDEVGPLELQGGGWACMLPGLLSRGHQLKIWVVRRSVIQKVKEYFGVQPVIEDVSNTNCLDRMLKYLGLPSHGHD